jgi:hypothetical protein
MEACAATYDNGIVYQPNPDWIPVIVKANTNCVVKTTEGQYVFVGLPLDDEALKNYLGAVPIYDAASLPDGMATWVLYRTEGDPTIKFAATKVWSALEIGSLHLSITSKVKPVTIHGAGELVKQGDTIRFNTLSGSYTLYWVKSRNKKRSCTGDELEDFISERFKSFFPGKSLPKVDTTFIRTENPVTQAELDMYRAAGFTVELFADAEACMVKLRGQVKRPRV